MTYKKKIRTLKLHLITILPIIYCVNLIISDSYDKFNSASFVLGIIFIPFCLLYYKMNTTSKLHKYIMVYISIFIENTSYWILSSKDLVPTYVYLDFFVLFRIMMLILILFPKNKLSVIMDEHKKNSLTLTILINFALVYVNYFVNENLHIYDAIIFSSINISMFILIVFILILLLKKSIEEENFIETTYTLGLMALSFRIRLIFAEQYINKLSLINSSQHFFIAFFIVLVGLFIEMNFIILENKKLNTDVKNISKNIEDMKEVEKLRSQFFANLSHELKTPINIIFSSIQLLNLKKEKSAAEFLVSYNKYDKTIKQNCFRMIRLINNLVDITKIDSGFIVAHFHNYNIIELVENICMSVIPYLENKHLNLVFDTLVEDVVIKCDSDYIERIILNALSNSIKFSKDNGNISVFMDADSDYVTIKISDDGIGIEKDKLNSVFETFIQGDKSLTRKKEGSGIGLSLVKSLVELHNGTINFNPNIDLGTELIIKLPNTKLSEENDNIINYNTDDNSILSKINIEFSDIYE